jgi:hypothetical protein
MSILLKAARPTLSAVASRASARATASRAAAAAAFPARATDDLIPAPHHHHQQQHRCFSGCGCSGSNNNNNHGGDPERRSFSATPDHSGPPLQGSPSAVGITERFYSAMPAMRPPAGATLSSAAAAASPASPALPVADAGSRRMTTDAANRDIADLLANNKKWAAQQKQQDPDFFVKLGGVHKPRCVTLHFLFFPPFGFY